MRDIEPPPLKNLSSVIKKKNRGFSVVHSLKKSGAQIEKSKEIVILDRAKRKALVRKHSVAT